MMDVREQIIRAIAGDSDTYEVDADLEDGMPVDNGFEEDE